MKLLPLIGAGMAVFAATTVHSAVITLGSSLAKSCFEAADARVASDTAMRTCDLALNDTATTQSDRVATHVNRGILHLIRRDYAVADRDFDRAIGMNPGEAEAWLNKAIVRLNQGDAAAALPLASRAMSLKTRRPELAYFVRGMAHEDRGQVRAAYSDLKMAQRLAPKWAEPAEELKRYRVKR